MYIVNLIKDSLSLLILLRYYVMDVMAPRYAPQRATIILAIHRLNYSMSWSIKQKNRYIKNYILTG